MKKKKMIMLLAVCILFLVVQIQTGFAKKGFIPEKSDEKKENSDCLPGLSQTELNVNNVRAKLLLTGDGWYDPITTTPGYEVPKVETGSGQPSLHSLCGGAMWMGGIDNLGQLRFAGKGIATNGTDYWPGPLDDNGQTMSETCQNFNRFWEVFSYEIDIFKKNFKVSEGNLNPTDIPENILFWPGKNNPWFVDFELPANQNLAPFYDFDDDGQYNPVKGDHPALDFGCEGIFADQMIWYVINDNGNEHSFTLSPSLGFEVSIMAFAYKTSDELNNMTFYHYNFENKSSIKIDSIYLGIFALSHIGTFNDDYMGCIPKENIGVFYNGDEFDELGYNDTPPMLGFDFIKTPRKIIGYDTEGNAIYQELGMTSFMPVGTGFSFDSYPFLAKHYYNYLRGRWTNGTFLTYGGYGAFGEVIYPFIYPSDPTDTNPEAWSECSENNTPFTRYFIQATGPFSLSPGSSEDLLLNMIWIRDGLEHPCPSFQPLIQASRKAQALFDLCFQLQTGPDAPDLFIRELDRELIISLWNDTVTSNNAFEKFAVADRILSSQDISDSLYTFQGYKLYQLVSQNVTPDQYDDPDYARLVAQVDKKDGLSKLVNWEKNSEFLTLIPKLKVDGSNNGIVNSFRITDDQFATGNKRLVNQKKYYFSAVAYSANSFQPYNPAFPFAKSQPTPYLEGRNNIKIFTAIPHIPAPQRDGIELNSQFGEGPPVTRISGHGNGGQLLELSEESVLQIIQNAYFDNPVYQGGFGPLNIQIFDPFNVPEAEFLLTIEDNTFPSYTYPNSGTLLLDNEHEVFLYESPDSDVITAFTYDLTDYEGQTDHAVVVIVAGTPQIEELMAFDNTAILQRSQASTVNIPLFSNDFAPDGINFSLASVEQSVNGAIISQNAETGIVTYQPNSEFNGIDRIKYTISSEGFESKSAYIHIKVYPAEVAAIDLLSANDDLFFIQTGTSTVLDVLENDIAQELKGFTISPKSKWTLENLTSGELFISSQDINNGYVQPIGGYSGQSLGFSIAIQQQKKPNKFENAVLSASLKFEDLRQNWFSLVSDDEGNSPFNWIRSGSLVSTENSVINDNRTGTSDDFYDPGELYENIIDGKIAPYCLTNPKFSTPALYKPVSPACSDCTGEEMPPTFNLENLHSIDLVFTPDKSKWTQSVVIEMSKDKILAQGNAVKNGIRHHASWNHEVNNYALPVNTGVLYPGIRYFVSGSNASAVLYTNMDGLNVVRQASNFFAATDIDQPTDFTTVNGAELYDAYDIGRSWFPGYAVNLETGERLNIIFGENSFFASEKGQDMIWNPNSTLISSQTSSSMFRIGGEHYVYVMSSRYDGGAVNQQRLIESELDNNITHKRAVFDDAMWVTLPYITQGFGLKSPEDGLIPSMAEINIRVARPYQQKDNQQPKLQYRFDFKDLAVRKKQTEIAQKALSLVNVVPNPYYAFSMYESSNNDNLVKITNLPAKANISIFSLEGSLIRTFKTDFKYPDMDTAAGGTEESKQINTVEWDLKNQNNLSIASGIYLIHVSAPDLGEETTLKFFCINRKQDVYPE